MQRAKKLVDSALVAQKALKTILKTLADEEDEALEKNEIVAPAFFQTGFHLLDDALQTRGVPQSGVIELVGEDEISLIQFALYLGLKTPQKLLALADPFGEIVPQLPKEGAQASLAPVSVTVDNPFSLAQALVRLIETSAFGAALIPPGVVKEKFLHAFRTDYLFTQNSRNDAFSRAIASLGWAARRNHCLCVVMIQSPEEGIVQTSGWAQMRLRVTPVSEKDVTVKVEHNVFHTASVGNRVRIALPHAFRASSKKY